VTNVRGEVQPIVAAARRDAGEETPPRKCRQRGLCALPATPDTACRFLSHGGGLTHYWHPRDLALIALGFAGVFRRSELAALRAEVDEAVGTEIARLLQPLGVAAIPAIADSEHQTAEKQRQIELALEQARYETARARR